MAFTKLRACRVWNGCVPAGTEIVIQTNSPNVYPGDTKVIQKLVEMGYPENKLKGFSGLSGVFKVVKD
jgi:hypothetical protein